MLHTRPQNSIMYIITSDIGADRDLWLADILDCSMGSGHKHEGNPEDCSFGNSRR